MYLAPLLESIDRQLREARERSPINAVLKAWRHDEVIVVCDRPRDLEDCPDLSLRVRGALGRRLRELHLWRGPDSCPDAWEVLWQYSPPKGCLFEVSRPYLVHACIVGDILVTAVRLFGSSRQFAPEVRDALVEALAGGIRLKTPRGIFVRLNVRLWDILRFEGLNIEAREMSECHIRFMTAVAVRNGRSLVLDPVSLLMSSVRRVAAVVPWMGMDLEFDQPKLRAVCSRFKFDMGGIRPADWVRHSIRQGSQEIAVHGLDGEIHFSGPLAEIYPYLKLAEITGIGSSTALGLGQIDCIFT